MPHADGKLLAELTRVADVRDRRYFAEGVELALRINRSQLRQLRGRFPSLEVMDGAGVDADQPAETADADRDVGDGGDE